MDLEARDPVTTGAVKPLVVDLDGTLIATDTLHESVLRALFRTPLGLLVAAATFLLHRNKARLKSAIVQLSGGLDVTALPYRPAVLARINASRQAGATVVLATGAHRSIAEAVAAHLGGFSAVLATEAVNLTGANKLASIRATVGEQPFEYIGDSAADLPVWAAAKSSVVVDPSPRLRRAIGRVAADHTELAGSGLSTWRSFVKQARIHQWSKNILVAIPLLASHRLFEIELVTRTLLAVLCFSFVASAIYVINDLADLDADRRHSTKRHRPLAAGAVSIPGASALAMVSGLAGLSLAAALGIDTLLVLASYAVLSTAYTFRLKQVLVLDVVVLASLYCLRVVAGGAVTGVTLSPWLLAFMIFEFFGLAMVKRSVELARMAGPSSGRGYRHADRATVRILGITSSLLGVLVFALYVQEGRVAELYPRHALLWLAVPLLLYWSARLWIVEDRGSIDDDPLYFVLKDRVSWLTVLALGAVLAVAAI